MTQERIPLVPEMSPHDILLRFEVRQTAKIKYICLFIHEVDLFSGLGKYEIVRKNQVASNIICLFPKRRGLFN